MYLYNYATSDNKSPLLIFLVEVFLLANICNYCSKKVLYNNVFLMFYRLGDIIYDGVSKNYSCSKITVFNRWCRCRYSNNDLGLETITILRMTGRVTNQILLFIMLVFFFIYFFSLLVFKNSGGIQSCSDLFCLMFRILQYFFDVTHFWISWIFND